MLGKESMSLRRMGSSRLVDAHFGVVMISDKYIGILSEADHECQELAMKWFEEMVMMLESKAELNFSDAQAVKKQLEKTRAKLADECEILVKNRQIVASESASEVVEEVASIASMLASAKELQTYVLKTWTTSNFDYLHGELDTLRDSHKQWQIGFHGRVGDAFATEAYQTLTASGEALNDLNSAIARLNARTGKDRTLASTYASTLAGVAEENDREKDRVCAATEELLHKACDSNDFTVAFELQLNLKSVVSDHQDEADGIRYRLEPSKRGKSKIMVSRETRYSRTPPR